MMPGVASVVVWRRPQRPVRLRALPVGLSLQVRTVAGGAMHGIDLCADPQGPYRRSVRRERRPVRTDGRNVATARLPLSMGSRRAVLSSQVVEDGAVGPIVAVAAMDQLRQGSLRCWHGPRLRRAPAAPGIPRSRSRATSRGRGRRACARRHLRTRDSRCRRVWVGSGRCPRSSVWFSLAGRSVRRRLRCSWSIPSVGSHRSASSCWRVKHPLTFQLPEGAYGVSDPESGG
jgi:hypothetical protein